MPSQALRRCFGLREAVVLNMISRRSFGLSETIMFTIPCRYYGFSHASLQAVSTCTERSRTSTCCCCVSGAGSAGKGSGRKVSITVRQT